MKTKLFILLAAVGLFSGCAAMKDAHEAYKNSGPLTPDGFNYTMERDRKTGDFSDYVGLTWSLK